MQDSLTFTAVDVTATHSLPVNDISPSLPAGAVADTLASRMGLPADVPWTIRDDATSVYLDEALPIGEQISSETTVTLTPKTHLAAKE
jgi:hypothetical protein